MSIILTIRNRFGKIAGGVIAVALIGFIVSDARNGSFGSMLGGHDSNVMTVNGTKVDSKTYNERVKEYETLTAIYNKRANMDDAAKAQISEQVLQSLAYETVVEKQCDKLGIVTTPEEEKELISGANAHPLIKQFSIDGNQIFINPDTHQFDPSIIKYLEKELKTEPQKIDPTGKLAEDWNAVKAYVIRNNRIDKFNTLFAASIYSPSYMAQRNITDQSAMASIRYVKVPFTTVPDNEAQVSDADVKAYMEKHKSLFETDQPTRSIDYVTFNIIPSPADTQKAAQALEEARTEFGTTKDIKTFVGSRSDDQNSYTEAYVNKKGFMSRYADTLMGQPVGGIYGPYFENGTFKMTKVTDRKTLPDSVKTRHILVMSKKGNQDIMPDSVAKQKIDSIVAAIHSGVPFDTMVRFSMDNGAVSNKGIYNISLAQRQGFVKEFGDFAFEGKAGENKVIKTDNPGYSGYHYIEVMSQSGEAPAIQMATITKNLAPSDSTIGALSSEANEFANKSANAAEFDASAKKMGLDKKAGDNIKMSNFTIPGLGSAREIVKWAYDAKVGAVSQVFQLGGEGDGRYVVAKLASVQDKGIKTLTTQERPIVEQRVREEKKAEIIAKKYGTPASLDAVAQGSGQQPMQTDSVKLGGAYIPGLGYEPKVVGYSFYNDFKPNTVSPGIKGQGGVYFITLLGRTTLPADANAMQAIEQQRQMQEGQMRNALGQMLQQSVVKNANVKYNPGNF